MELVIGGRAQGKTEYVKRLHPDAMLFDEASYPMLLSGDEAFGQDRDIVWNHFHLAVRRMLGEGMGQEEIWERLRDLQDRIQKLIVISDEIGNGIVPMGREERSYRETTGRLLCLLAGEADQVTRIVCGIPVPIK